MRKLVTISQQVDELQINEFARVNDIISSHECVSLFISQLKWVIGFITILDNEGIDATLTRFLVRGDLLLSSDDFVTNTLQTALEEISNFIERLGLLYQASWSCLTIDISKRTWVWNVAHGDRLKRVCCSLVADDTPEDVLREAVLHGLGLDWSLANWRRWLTLGWFYHVARTFSSL